MERLSVIPLHSALITADSGAHIPQTADRKGPHLTRHNRRAARRQQPRSNLIAVESMFPVNLGLKLIDNVNHLSS